MARPYIPDKLRTLVFDRAGGRCEYCLLHQDDTFSRHPIDHIVPVVHGGETNETNLALACTTCNSAKGPNLTGLDPLSGSVAALFNPRQQRWERHFRLEGATIVGLTQTGRATVRVLRMNSIKRVDERLYLQMSQRYPSN